MAVNVPVVQLPVPPMSVKTQGEPVNEPARLTVPVGVAPAPVTLTVTTTVPLTAEGLGLALIMVVVLGPWWTVWAAVIELLV